MPHRSSQTRRRFLENASLGAAGVCLARAELLAAPSSTGGNKICAFTKPFQKLSFDALANRIAELGFDGIEAPVRPGGHIEPANVERELPRLAEALAKRNLEICVIASGIKSLDEPHTKSVLRTATELNIKKYRLAYFQYDLKRPIAAQVLELRPALRDLVAYSKELGILPLYQNHCGAEMVGAPVWDVHQLFGELPTVEVGMAFDLAHATIEGGQCWPLHVNLMWPYIHVLYVKDFVWDGSQVEWVPLGDGRADQKFYRELSQRGFRGPLSIHVEYLDQAAEGTQLAALKKDLKKLRQWLHP